MRSSLSQSGGITGHKASGPGTTYEHLDMLAGSFFVIEAMAHHPQELG